MGIIVHKYGGTSLGTINRLGVVADHIAASAKDGQKLLVVVSAMGQKTDELLELAKAINPNPPERELDMLLTAGERISMALLSMALHKRDIRSVSLTGSQSGILTRGPHGNAEVLEVRGNRIANYLEQNQIVIVAGFQGVDPETKEITTLGRGGSDLSAVVLASRFKADLCEIYSDIPGVCSADPRLVSDAFQINQCSWRQLRILAEAGAAVMHDRAARHAEECLIPMRVRSAFDLGNEGTMIDSREHANDASLLSVVCTTAEVGISDVTVVGTRLKELSDLKSRVESMINTQILEPEYNEFFFKFRVKAQDPAVVANSLHKMLKEDHEP